jgi:hypothetical protein
MSKQQPKAIVKGDLVDEDELRNGDGPKPEPIDPPEIAGARFGLVGRLYRMHRAYKKERRLADKGYVKWFLVGSSWPEPKFVKPEQKGGGIPEYEHDGEIYAFPDRARLASRSSGMWTVIHKEGEFEPITLRDPTEDAIKADEVKEYLNKRITTDPPSWFDNFDLDPQDIIMYAVAAIIVLAVLQSVLGGGA